MENETLRACLARLRRGELDALEEIFAAMQTPVYAVVRRIVADPQTAEEVTQDVFVRLWQSPPGEEVTRPRAWLFRVAHNLAIDALRRAPLMPPPAPRAEEDTELRLDLEAALAKLPPREREIVALHLNAGLRFREIAQAMDLPLGTALWRYSRALGRLRAELDGGTT